MTHQFVQEQDLHNIMLVGHSMGGLVALLYAEQHPDRVQAFINIEGNLSSEDCLFSREIIKLDFRSFKENYLPALQKRFRISTYPGTRHYAEALTTTSPRAMYDYCPSLVQYSDSGTLIDRYRTLPMPTLFLYGAKSLPVSHLAQLKAQGCKLTTIPESGHAPMIDNPTALYTTLANFIATLGQQRTYAH